MNKDQPPTTAADVDALINEVRNDIENAKKNAETIYSKLVDIDPSKKDLVEDMRKNLDNKDPLNKKINKEPENKAPEADKLEPTTPDLSTPPEPPEPTPEVNNRTPEQKVDETRDKYTKEYLKCRKEMRTEIAIDSTQNALANIFRSKRHKKVFKEEDYFTPAYKRAKREYDEARGIWGKELLDVKRIELEGRGVTGAELELELKKYKAKDVADKTFFNEHQKLIDAKVAGSPVNVASWKKVVNWYVKLPRTKKVLLSTGIFMAAGSIAAGGATVSLLGLGLGRFTRGMASGFISSNITKLVDVVNKKRNKKFEADQGIDEKSLRDQFGAGTLTQEQFEKKIGELEAKDKGRLRNQALMKLGVGVVSGVGFGMLSSHLGGQLHGHAIGDSSKHLNEGLHDQTPPTPDQTIPTPPSTGHSGVEALVGKGHGAIKTIHEFQDKLKAEYPDPSKAPASVQHILNTKADRLAIEYGMFKPGQDAESAIMKLGSEFKVDADGNLSFHQAGTTDTTILEKGVDSKVTEAYAGHMIDGDHSGGAHIAHHQPEANHVDKDLLSKQVSPEGAEPVPKVDANADLISAQKVPAGAVENTVNQDLLAKQVNPEGTVATNTAGNVSPTENQYDTGSGANNSTIRPLDRNYTTGNAGRILTPDRFQTSNNLNNLADNDNGFTKTIPMTRTALQENFDNSNTGSVSSGNNVVEGVSVREGGGLVDVNRDLRHLENSSQVKEIFGKSHVIMDRPDDNTINGIKISEWNKTTDQLFREKGFKFDSYADYEKERQLQELFGHATKGVEYVDALDKNADVITMYSIHDPVHSPDWPIVKEIPAKHFFDFHDAKLADGNPIPQDKLDILVDKGVIQDNITNNGGAIEHNYSFSHQADLERIQKLYEKFDPLNSKPLGDENIEKYIGRITRDMHQANDGTLYILKNNGVITEKMLDDGSILKPERVSGLGRQVVNNNYSSGNSNVSSIAPRYGSWQTASDYNKGMAGKALDILGYRRWTY